MNKLNYFIITFFIFFISISAKAVSYNSGKLYDVYWQEAGVNVFAKDTTYNAMDYNGIMSMSNQNNYVHYCIEPETYMQHKSEAKTNTHYVYTTDQNIIKNSRLNQTTLNKIKLLAYYGYQYQDNVINHSSKKWYGIAQVLIWKLLRNDIKYVFKTSRNGTTNTSLYLSEINELEQLINNHDKKPSFSNESIKLTLNNSIILEDTNLVLNNYYINTDEHLDLQVKDNKLYIKGLKEGTGTINIYRPKLTNEITLFKSSSLQDLITRGNINNEDIKINYSIEGKTITIKKIDADSKTFNDNLKGSVFELYNDNNELLQTISINNENETFILPYGKYYLKEIKTNIPYKINEEKIEFEVTSETNNIVLEIPNEKIKGILKILKLKGGPEEHLMKEVEAIFKITDENGNNETIKTDENGEIKVVLVYGKYNITQIKGEDEYEYIKEFQVNITEEKEYYYELKNLKKSKLVFTKLDYSSNKPLKDAEIEIYDEDNNLLHKSLTDKNGNIIIEKIDIGKYYIKEVTAPKYYRLNKELLWFEVQENGLLIKVDMSNERKEGILIFNKVDLETGNLLKDAAIEIYFKESMELVFSGKTNGEPIVLDTLIAGTYYIKEKEAPNGYLLNKNNIEFEIEEDNQVVKVIMTNEKIKIPETSISKAYLIIPILIILLFMSSIKRYEKN